VVCIRRVVEGASRDGQARPRASLRAREVVFFLNSMSDLGGKQRPTGVTQQKQVVSSGRLDTSHVRQLIRLLSEARELQDGGPERAQYLMSGVSRIISADAGAAILEPHPSPAGPGQRAATVLIGRDGAGWGALEVLRQAGSVLIQMIRAMMRIAPDEPGVAVTATWHELITDRRWCSSEHAVQGLRPGWIGDAIFSSVRLGQQRHVHGLGLYRGPESRPFSEEERALVSVFHAECEGLLNLSRCDEGHDVQAQDRLSPRQRQTLALVLSGLCDKEIAERLGISRYTVNQYTKVIYRHYAVTSRAQLLALMLVRPRGDALPNRRD